MIYCFLHHSFLFNVSKIFLINFNISNAATQFFSVSIELSFFLHLSFLFFLLGLFGLLYNFKNFLVSMMAIELMYLGVILSFSFASTLYPSLSIYALYVIILAACESAVGLGLLIVLYRFNQTVALADYVTLKTPSSIFLWTRPSAFFIIQYQDSFNDYTLLLIYFFLASIICFILGVLVYVFALNTTRDTEKLSEYECGFAPFDSATRRPFDVHFYLVGILFLIFDVELALLFPWVNYACTMNEFSNYLVFSFLFILGLGFVYEWTCGALNWPLHTFQKFIR